MSRSGASYCHMADAFRRGLLACRAEVGVDHARVLGQVVGRAFERDLAHLEHVAVVGHLERGARVLLDQQDGHAGGAQAVDGAEDLLARPAARGRGWARRASAASGWLISARPTASICRSPPESVPASCVRRSFRRGNSVKTCSSACAAVLVAAAAPGGSRRAAGCPRPAWCRTARVSRAPARCPASRAPRACAAPMRLAAVGDRAARGQHAHQRVEQRRLAGAVRADHGDDAALRRPAGSGRAAPRRGRSRRAGP